MFCAEIDVAVVDVGPFQFRDRALAPACDVSEKREVFQIVRQVRVEGIELGAGQISRAHGPGDL